MNPARVAAAVTLAVTCAAGAAAAQGVRGTASVSTRFIELRSLRTDTVDPSAVVRDADGRFRVNGIPVDCRPAIPCVLFRPGEREQGVTLTQDLRFTAWGFGVRHLSATAYVRARAQGGDFTFPRSDDAFDALIAYVEYDNAPVRVRLGRQVAAGGLGFSSFDGASALYRTGSALAAELYGGRSLARGLYEPRADVLRGLEDFVPDQTVLLFGGALDVRPVHGLDLAARYQREIFSDRSGLASERASAEAVVTLAPLTILGSVDYDFAFDRIGKADVRARVPLPSGFSAELRGRRYVPYFELWTIWGFFDPVAYHEAEALVAWRADPRVGLLAAGAYRAYEETNAAVFGPTLASDSRRVTVGGWWQPASEWRLDGSVRRETGFGAAYGGGDVSAQWQPAEGTFLRAWATAFEQIEEFRVGEGSVLGGGIDASIRLRQRWVVDGGVGLYRHGSTRRDSPDWNQRRAWLAVRVEFGDDPGLRARSASR